MKLVFFCIRIGQQKNLEEQLAQRLHRMTLSNEKKKDNEQQRQEEDKFISTVKGNEKQLFVQKCLDLLVAIQDSLLSVIENEQEHTEREYIGIRDLRLVHTLLQVIISWGMYPYFLPGVGVPLSKRVKSGYTNHELLTQQDQSNTSSLKASTKEGITQLLQTTSGLVDLISKTFKVPTSQNYTTVGSILLQRHLPDLFAALLQLAYAPAPKSTISSTPSATISNPAMFLQAGARSQQNAIGITRAERDKCARMFAWLFERADVHRCMESLMLLLGTSPLHPVPIWLRSICGRFLSKILLRPNGVATVIEFTVGDVENVSLDQLEKITKLILAVPQQMSSVESYYTVIAPQLLTLLNDNIIGSKIRLSTRQVVTFIIGRMIGTHPNLSKTLIVDKIIGTLVDSWNIEYIEQSQEEECQMDIIPEEEMEQLLKILHQMMVGGEPSPVVIQTFLGDAVIPLYYLYDFTVKSKSGLRETVLDILITYFRIMSPQEILRDLKTIVLSKRDLAGARLVYFKAGPSGGVVLCKSSFMRPLAGNQLPIDPKVMIEFIQKTNSPDLCGDFFLFLLNQYTSLQTLSDADPRLMLLILQLIMGMQDTLGTEILSKPEQILAFANNVVTDYVDRLDEAKNRYNSKKKSSSNSSTVDIMNIVSDEDREIIGNMPTEEDIENDLESLIMAINLLRAVMHENDELSSRSSQLLESSVGPLKQLESYRIQELQEPVHEIMLAITSYISAQKLSNKSKDKKNNKNPDNGSEEKFLEAMRALQDDLLPVRAHGIGILRDLVLAKDPLISSGEALDNVLDIFIRLVQDEDSYIYLNAIKGLSALTDIHGNAIIKKLGDIYADEKESLDNRLRVGEALLQTVQRSGEALSLHVGTLVKPLEKVLARRKVDTYLRVSALSILSTACQTCPMALKGFMQPLTNWVLNILEFEKEPEIRRASTMLILSLFRGLATDTLYQFPTEELRRTYRTLRYIEETDTDELTRNHARTALSDLNVIMRRELFE
ncbi:hypothetical protein BDC45DRAFT_510575 [Circinella umbellata]|nr:hypothetical protein BDC45DRAFT_510575 [Circinella umbellata]